MVKIQVSYYGLPIADLGSEPFWVELPPGATVAELLQTLVPNPTKQEQDFIAAMTVMIKGNRVEKDELLSDGAKVLILSPLVGG